MVTHFDRHWDEISETSYSLKMLKGKMSINELQKHIKLEIPTIFIKLRKENKDFEKAWEGYTYDFKILGNKIHFKVKILKEVDVPSHYRTLSEGWYVESNSEDIIFEKTTLYPPLFYLLKKIQDWTEFEEYVYYILKLLGIHDIIRYEQQRGHPDGFFKFGNLVVIYDATLETNFEESKRQQIDNYCNLLKSGKIEHGNVSFDVSGCRKHVWIITRGVSRAIGEKDGVVIKEVSVDDIIEVYLERLKRNLREVELEEKLRNI